MKQYYQKNKERVLGRVNLYRKNNYDTALESSRNYKRNHRRELSEKQRQYASLNKEKIQKYLEDNKEDIRAHQKLYYTRNKSEIRRKARAYYWANRDEKNSQARGRYLTNRDYIISQARQKRADNLEFYRKRDRDWTARNKDKVYNTNQRKRARKHRQPATMTVANWHHALDYFRNCCAVCCQKLNNAGWSDTVAQDHWIALSSPDCPGYVPTNIIPLCHGLNGCNNSKGAKDAAVWLTERYGKSKAQEILARIETYFASLE